MTASQQKKDYNKRWIKEHPENMKIIRKRYADKTREQRKLYDKNRTDSHYPQLGKFREIRKKNLNLKINGCAICGYNKCDAALEFHHVNPENKKFSLGARNTEYLSNRVIEELNKCILLCANCHREVHYKEKLGRYKYGKM